eukprot:Gregarina_sp_Poly_1__4874@NODE_2594_length_1938_cov_121_157670_g967_i1_p1_GENE_NODE_2594_length_1938_cov_121_157670_g967_i1NODE_2594_length_1938_cov_121_157670_g967_i1_p1_ORF_typecomplete_len479_score57_84_NODE_2594_length_1938_cov_121_157670_g967_i15001786
MEPGSAGVPSAPAWVSETARRDLVGSDAGEDPEPAIGLLQILLRPSRKGYNPRSASKKIRQAPAGGRSGTKQMSPGDRSAESRESDSRSPPTLDFTWLTFPVKQAMNGPSSHRSDPVFIGEDLITTPRSEVSKKEHTLSDDVQGLHGGHCEEPAAQNQSCLAQRRRSAAKLIEISAAVPPALHARRADNLKALRRVSLSKEDLASEGGVRRRSVDDFPVRMQSTEKSGDSTRKHSATAKNINPPKKPPKSFVLFRLSSTRSVKDFTRLLLDIIDEYNSAGTESSTDTGAGRASSVEAFPASQHPESRLHRPFQSETGEFMRSTEPGLSPHWAAYVPHLSNASLDLLMTLCLDQPPPISQPQTAKHGRAKSGSIGSGPSPKQFHGPCGLDGIGATWLFRYKNGFFANELFRQDIATQTRLSPRICTHLQ